MQICGEKNGDLSTLTWGRATLNGAYITVDSGSYIKWERRANIVTVTMYDVVLKKGYSTENVAVIATGLPKPADNIYLYIPVVLSDTSALGALRCVVDTNGVFKPWYWYTTQNSWINGTFSYVAL